MYCFFPQIVIGTAVFYAHGMLPEVVLDSALKLPLHVPTPMAPAEG